MLRFDKKTFSINNVDVMDIESSTDDTELGVFSGGLSDNMFFYMTSYKDKKSNYF